MEPKLEDSRVIPSTEDLTAALVNVEVVELQAMGKRFLKSRSDMDELLTVLHEERESLNVENKQLRETIELMMGEMKKLNIGAGNTVEPVLLDDNPLNMVGRLWEKMRPRDTAVVVSEHLGEIKKPVAQEEDEENVYVDDEGNEYDGDEFENPHVERARQAAEKAAEKGKEAIANAQMKSKQVAGRLGAALGDMWQTAPSRDEVWQGVPSRGEFLQQGQALWAAAADGATKPKRKSRPGRPDPMGYNDGDGKGLGKGGQPPAAPSQQQASASSSSEPAHSSQAPSQAPVVPAAPTPEAKAEPEKPATPADAVAIAEDGSDLKEAGAEEQIASTILIEAQLTLDDGTEQTRHVRAADRCKEVSARFIKEHSLKAWFEQPLTNWLKKVESDADKFPITIEGNLLEIRKLYSKGSQ